MSDLIRKNDAEFGKALFEAAVDLNNQNRQQLLVGRVTDLLDQVDRYERVIEQLEQDVEVLKQRVEAIKKGKFTLNRGGKMIQYTDSELDRAPFNLDNLASAIRLGQF